MKRRILALFFSLAAACSTELGDRCENNDSCPEGQYCARVAVCTLECGAGAACPEGSACTLVESRSVCLRSCTEDGECNDTESCQNSVCRIADPLKPL